MLFDNRILSAYFESFAFSTNPMTILSIDFPLSLDSRIICRKVNVKFILLPTSRVKSRQRKHIRHAFKSSTNIQITHSEKVKKYGQYYGMHVATRFSDRMLLL